jgi:aminoglycoside/choline kinase family phosphotransferase
MLGRWLREDLGFAGCEVAPASADASFRRYFRVRRDADSFIVMDAPPDKEDVRPYLRVTTLLAEKGLNVPLVLARNLDAGFLLLTDLGQRLYLPELARDGAADPLYGDALGALLHMQAPGAGSLPAYDRALLVREMELLPEWFLARHLGIAVGAAERAMLERLWEALIQPALAQPAVFVHRDYHSRNLMVCPGRNPGILDFQDAVLGPLTYDLVSLLKDCYIEWPAPRVRAWALGFRDRLRERGLPAGGDESEFLRWFDLMGLQRHIKVLGIFCRLYYRDGKRQYLHDLPRVLAYVRAAAAQYPETAEWSEFITARIAPQFEAAQLRVLGS